MPKSRRRKPPAGGMAEESPPPNSDSDSDVEDPRDYRRGGYHSVEVGELFKRGRYVAAKKLGWGHFSTVWLAWDRHERRAVALKIQKSAPRYSETARDEIKLLKQVSEAKARLHAAGHLQPGQAAAAPEPDDAAAAALLACTSTGPTGGGAQPPAPDHGGGSGGGAGRAETVVELRDHFVHRGPHGAHHVLCFEVLGPSLLHLLKQDDYRGLPLSHARRLAKCLLSALAFIHAEGIIHTDVKPENVLVDLSADEVADFEAGAMRADAEVRALDAATSGNSAAAVAGRAAAHAPPNGAVGASDGAEPATAGGEAGEAAVKVAGRSKNTRKRIKQKEKRRLHAAGGPSSLLEAGAAEQEGAECALAAENTEGGQDGGESQAEGGAAGWEADAVTDAMGRVAALSLGEGVATAPAAVSAVKYPAASPLTTADRGQAGDAMEEVAAKQAPTPGGAGAVAPGTTLAGKHPPTTGSSRPQGRNGAPLPSSSNGTTHDAGCAQSQPAPAAAPAQAALGAGGPAPTFKLADLGNGCWRNMQFTQDIQTRQYRCPEVILGQGYDTASDVWSAACVVFEAVTGDVLFTPKAGKQWSRDEDHLALMLELIGPMPRKLTGHGTHARDFFRGGELRHIKRLRPWPLVEVLKRKYEMPPDEAEGLAAFLIPMLQHDPAKRATAEEALRHPWLSQPA